MHGDLDKMLQHHGRAVTRDFDYVVGGVGVRLGGDVATTSSMRSPVDGSISSLRNVRVQPQDRRACAKRSVGWAMSRASGPESRTTPIPPRPGGVAIMATMVSSRCMRRLFTTGHGDTDERHFTTEDTERTEENQEIWVGIRFASLAN